MVQGYTDQWVSSRLLSSGMPVSKWRGLVSKYRRKWLFLQGYFLKRVAKQSIFEGGLSC
jgi:hypothetical protein